jgi:hypothetical protein
MFKRLFGSKREANYTDKMTEFLKINKNELFTILKKQKINELETLDEYIKILESKTIIAKKNKLECPICFDNMVDICIVPCGHTFCSKCIDGSKLCYICKNEIFMCQSLYFP